MAWGASDPFVKSPAEQKHKLPYIVALTGGIASGKSLISDEFAKLGVPVIDTDIIAHEIVAPGQPALREIADAFGPGVIDSKGGLKRTELRRLIFSDPDSRSKLESILHPRIRQIAGNAIAKVASAYCILVIPLLAEKGGYANVDRILVVDTEPGIQIERLMARDKNSRKQAEQALSAQASREQRLNIADDVLDNSGSPEQARQEVARLHLMYLQLAENR